MKCRIITIIILVCIYLLIKANKPNFETFIKELIIKQQEINNTEDKDIVDVEVVEVE